MVTYTCRRCGYSCKNKSYFKKHLLRKVTCSPILENIEIAEKQREESEEKVKEFEKIILNSKLEAKNLFNEARQKVLEDVDKKRSELEKSIEAEIVSAEKEIQSLNSNSLENIKKIATDTSADLITQLIGQEVDKNTISKKYFLLGILSCL